MESAAVPWSHANVIERQPTTTVINTYFHYSAQLRIFHRSCSARTCVSTVTTTWDISQGFRMNVWGRRLAQLVERVSHVHRLCPRCSGPESRPGALYCVSLPLSLILFPVMASAILSKMCDLWLNISPSCTSWALSLEQTLWESQKLLFIFAFQALSQCRSLAHLNAVTFSVREEAKGHDGSARAARSNSCALGEGIR